MGKKSAARKDKPKGKGKEDSSAPAKASASEPGVAAASGGKMSGKDYAREMKKLHVELVKLQEWVKHKGSRFASSSRAATAPARAAPSRRSPSA